MENLPSKENLQKFPTQQSFSYLQGLKYCTEKFIGYGSFSNCFLVRSTEYNEYFVLKEELIEKHLQNSSFINNELQILLELNHPNIIKIYRYFSTDKSHCLVLEYCSGGSLADYIKKNGPIRPPLLFDWCYQILEALYYMHQKNISHRDIKPNNILIDKYNRIKIADFNLSQEFEVIKQNPNFVGTDMFMSPEIKYKFNFDPFKVDVWACGVTFYLMVEGAKHKDFEMKKEFNKFQTMTPNKMELNSEGKKNENLKEFYKIIKLMLTLNHQCRPTISEILNYPLFQYYKTQERKKTTFCKNVCQIKTFKSIKKNFKISNHSSSRKTIFV
jgi:serine/threonine protein kinase